MITRLVFLFSSTMSALAKQPMEGAISKPAFHTLHQIPSCKSHHLFTDILRTRGGGYIRGGGNGRYDDYGGNDDDFERGRYDEDRYNDRYGSRDDPDYYGDGYRDERDDAAPSKIPVGYVKGLLPTNFTSFSHAKKTLSLFLDLFNNE